MNERVAALREKFVEAQEVDGWTTTIQSTYTTLLVKMRLDHKSGGHSISAYYDGYDNYEIVVWTPHGSWFNRTFQQREDCIAYLWERVCEYDSDPLL